MYKRIHITVDRASFRSRGKTLARARQELEAGHNLGFFPEGGILLKKYPTMVKFKEGAFRVAAESNTPIIPITFPTNYKILADDDVMNMRPGKCQIIYHPPIYPTGATEEDVKKLQQEVFRVIQSELDTQNQDSNKPSY